MTVYLVGGGVDSVSTPGLLNPFTRDLEERARSRARVPRLAVVLDDQWGRGEEFLPDYVDALECGAAEVIPVFLRREHPAAARTFADVDGIVVGGGPTPAYCEGLEQAREVIRNVVSDGVPYLGFSAGAMVASQAALVGGWRLDGRDVCPEEWSEGLERVTLQQGLGLVPFTVDVHTAQAGLLGRAVSLVDSGRVDRAVAVDEDTCLALTDSTTTVVSGGGSAWSIVATGDGRSVWVTRDVGPSRPTSGRRP